MAKRGVTSGRRVRSMGRLEVATAATIVVGALAILVAERRRPLRRRTQSEPRRELQNLVLGIGCAGMVSLAETPVVEHLARRAEAGRHGLVQKLPWPPWARDLLGIVLMDYTFYLWHVLTHKIPALWRLHLVHHVDLDLDASTAVRFHAVDMLVSAPWRYAQVALIGLSPAGVRLWRAFFFLSILFHHSNLRLPERWERRLAFVLTTPRMHGIHHSAVQAETDSNWSSGLSFWDRLHGTFRLDVPQSEIAIGVPAYRAAEDVAVGRSLVMPFRRQRRDWLAPVFAAEPSLTLDAEGRLRRSAR